MKLVQIIFDVGYGIRGVASVLRHHIEVDQCLDEFESVIESDYWGPSGLAEGHGQNSKNTAPQIPHLFPLPLCNFTIGLFADQEPRVWRYCLPNIAESLQSPMFLQKAFDLVYHVLE